MVQTLFGRFQLDTDVVSSFDAEAELESEIDPHSSSVPTPLESLPLPPVTPRSDGPASVDGEIPLIQEPPSSVEGTSEVESDHEFDTLSASPPSSISSSPPQSEAMKVDGEGSVSLGESPAPQRLSTSSGGIEIVKNQYTPPPPPPPPSTPFPLLIHLPLSSFSHTVP